MKRLSQQQVDSYRKDGYLVVPDLLSSSMMEALQEATAVMIAKAAKVGKSDSVFDFTSGPEPELRRIKAPERHQAAYAQVLVANEVLDCIEDLIGGDIRFWASKLNLKQPQGGQAVEWHQDWAFGPATNDDVLTIGLALDDATVENGCLLVTPGSQVGPVLDHWREGRFVGGVMERTFPVEEAVPLEVRAGGMTIHHVRTLHGSAPNHSAKQRRLLLYTYAAADAWPLSGVSDQADFDAKMLRGKAPAAPRLEQVPVRAWPRWEEEELAGDTSIFDFQDRSGASLFS